MKFHIDLVKEHWDKLNDKTTRKGKIWTSVAQKLNDKGFIIQSTKPGQTCSQKWQNLLKAYNKFNTKVNATGSGSDVLDHKPPFYDEIPEISGNSHI